MTAFRTTRLLTAPLALALALVLSTVSPGHASSTTKKDPRNDVFLGSGSGGIDLAAVQLRTRNGGQRIQVSFRLHSPAPTGSLEKPGGMAAEFIRNKRIWRVVRVVTVGGVLHSEVCSYSRREEVPEPYDCSRLRGVQVDDRTYRTVVKLKQVKKGAKVLQWTAGSMDLSSGAPVIDSVMTKNRQPFRWRL